MKLSSTTFKQKHEVFTTQAQTKMYKVRRKTSVTYFDGGDKPIENKPIENKPHRFSYFDTTPISQQPPHANEIIGIESSVSENIIIQPPPISYGVSVPVKQQPLPLPLPVPVKQQPFPLPVPVPVPVKQQLLPVQTQNMLPELSLSISSLIEKYRPKSSSEVVGNSQNIGVFKKWVADKKKKTPGVLPLVLLHGPPGIGKTSIAHAVLREHGYDIFDINVSLRQFSENTLSFFQDILLRKSLMKQTAMILDEIDGDDETRGAIDSILKIFKSIEKNHGDLAKLPPIVCIANDVYSKHMKRLKVYAKNIRMFHPWKNDLERVLCLITQKEQIELSLSDKNSLILECGGDLRRLVGLLESRKITKGTSLSSFVQLTKQDSFQNIFNLTQYILYSTTSCLKLTKSSLIRKCLCEASSPCYVAPGCDIATCCKDCPQRTFVMSHVKGPQCLCEKTPPPTFVDLASYLIESDFSRVTLFIQQNYITACQVRYEKKQIQTYRNMDTYVTCPGLKQPQPQLLPKPKPTCYQNLQLSELSTLADTLSDTDVFQKSIELYKDDEIQAGALYSTWLAQSVLCYRGGKKSLLEQTTLTQIPDITQPDFFTSNSKTKQILEELKILCNIEISPMSHQTLEDLNNTFSTLKSKIIIDDVSVKHNLYETRQAW